VDVKYPPTFSPGQKGKTIAKTLQHGKSMTLSCESNENPIGTVKWLFGKDKKSLKPMGERSRKLIINKMSSASQGFYECIVKNSFGSSNKYFNVFHQANSKSQDFNLTIS
jgi:Immunoglobulin domain